MFDFLFAPLMAWLGISSPIVLILLIIMVIILIKD